MKAVIQRVTQASVAIDGKETAQIGAGMMVLLGVVKGDREEEARALAARTAALRIFEDDSRKLNRSLLDTGGSALVVSNFTLCADGKKSGNRPSFTLAADPAEAKGLYERFCAALGEAGVSDVRTGEFGADMAVSLCNDGPVTVILDTDGRKERGGADENK